ncbi:uncharacterized protein K02A2.6-like [Anneissia japonica]|uniref:uncharacterized protein K02A2.6-like n=1 Tax=Anneissia japonica TaxID=1529436 RepID=UPI001425AAA4|nr:uncharacterized protein K02A2.6-like [Anneissia japonica]
MSKLPTGPWKELIVEFAELPLAYLLVIIYDYSRFPVVEVIKSVIAVAVIPRIEKIFSEFGVPNVLNPIMDRHSTVQISSFIANDLGFKDRKTTPYWPRVNDEAEGFMKTIKKAIKASMTTGKNWTHEMLKFLHNYRGSPHSSTNVPQRPLVL